jgi:endonuclease V-like protein UPF0215 family
LKKQVRILGVDDSPFEFRKSKTTWLVGAIYRGNLWMEGVMVDMIEVDGMDATDAIRRMIVNPKFSSQIRVVFLDGITFGGFNLADVDELHRKTGVPIVSIVERMPNIDRIKRSMRSLPNFEKRLEVVSRADQPIKVRLNGTDKPLYIQSRGIDRDELMRVLESSRKAGTVPEALRAARMIASALPENR